MQGDKLSGTIVLKRHKTLIRARRLFFSAYFTKARFSNSLVVFLAFVLLVAHASKAATNLPKKVEETNNMEVLALEIPSKIQASVIDLDLKVKPADVEKDTWQLFDDAASFGRGSAALNSAKGNTVIFAHAKSKLFARLNDLNENDEVLVKSKLNTYKFVVSQKLYVEPSDIEFINRDYGKSLILFTCYGPDDEKRVVIIAKFVEVQNV